jgi:cytochrome P450
LVHTTSQRLKFCIFQVNFAAIHTSTQGMTQTLYHLAANPGYADVMREEVQSVVEAEGWTKAALQNMRKVDSFIKEVQRMDGLGLSTSLPMPCSYILS